MEVEVEENGASAGRGCVVQGGEGDAEMEVEVGEDGASAGTKVLPKRAAWRAAPTPPLLTRVRPKLGSSDSPTKRASLHPSTVTLLVFLHEAIPGGIEREA